MWKGKKLFEGVEGSRRRAIYKANGYTDEDLLRPHIGVVNTFNEAAPGHAHMRQIAEAAKAGVWQAGGTPFEFGTISTCGAPCVGADNKALRYKLVIRDIICGSIEIVAMEHMFDGLVLLSSCDSIIPAGANHLKGPFLENVGIDESIPIAVDGLDDKEEFTKVHVTQEKDTVDAAKMEAEVVEVAQRLVKNHSDIGAIVFECSDLPPFAAAAQEAVNLPIFDFITLTNMIYQAVVQRRYVGFM
jgi:hypothetical protein